VQTVTPPVLVRRSAVASHFARTVSFSGETQAAMQSTLLGRQSSLTLCCAGTVNGGGLRGTATGEEDGGAITDGPDGDTERGATSEC
jgi:hypothetical protein